ncbi:integrase catalytic domain-containing protein [Trichonephila clavata]|uniref:Integrase catalytic domain-containing protein n=1 Tax=Trichonephila clavata TaxID=2740835 RepID=A0A8X6HFX4_TRICU|nr:integrase catalytic domain-containing protein [Trichonephila clavata]
MQNWGDREKGQLSLDELESAEIQLIRSVQAQCFVDEKSISNLCVFRDHNNIIRVKTRITERIDTSLFLSPILLPNNCIFTQRLVEHFHLKNHHAGTQLLLSIIREKYWIVGGRRTVRKIWNACVKCRRFKSKSSMTDPVSLPADRVKDAAVFEVDLTPITPAMFLFEIQTAETKDLEIRDANNFRKRLRFRAKVIEELKKRFRNEYLGQLIQRQKQHPVSSNICEGDIVLIGDDWKKRLQWPLARVIKLIPGKDGLGILNCFLFLDFLTTQAEPSQLQLGVRIEQYLYSTTALRQWVRGLYPEHYESNRPERSSDDKLVADLNSTWALTNIYTILKINNYNSGVYITSVAQFSNQ